MWGHDELLCEFLEHILQSIPPREWYLRADKEAATCQLHDTNLNPQTSLKANVAVFSPAWHDLVLALMSHTEPAAIQPVILSALPPCNRLASTCQPTRFCNEMMCCTFVSWLELSIPLDGTMRAGCYAGPAGQGTVIRAFYKSDVTVMAPPRVHHWVDVERSKLLKG